MNEKCIIVCIIFCVNLANSAKVLYVYNTPWRSHLNWNYAIVEGLSERGHTVYMAGPWASKKSDDNSSYIAVDFEVSQRVEKKYISLHTRTLPPFKYVQKFTDYAYHVCNNTYHTDGFKYLWNEVQRNVTFDVILIDVTLGECLFPLIEHFNYPTSIAVSAHTFASSEVIGDMVFRQDKILHSGYSPFVHYNVSEIQEPTKGLTGFTQRLWNYVYTKYSFFKHNFDLKNSIETLAGDMLLQNFDWQRIQQRISLFFVNHNPILDDARVLPPNVIPIGTFHVKTNESMNPILNSILDNAETGFIFCSFGGNIDMRNVGLSKRKALATAFDTLERRTVLWKYFDNEDEIDRPENVMVHNWLPQNALLGHENAKLIITNGGLLSLQEAAIHGVPILAIPFTSEQRYNVQKFIHQQMGLILEYNDLNPKDLYDAIMELLENPIYTENIRNLSLKLRGQPDYLRQKALFWVEYTIRHNGTEFLIPKSRDLPYLVATGRDVELFLAFISILLCSVIFIVFICVLKKFCCRKTVLNGQEMSDKKNE